ncbi:protein phosphatase 2C domain-containing protein [Streptomyces sp. NRRL F-2664]|uniref:protein phosphatase 2C domain-containing protein n=1 Tax=Streptomyces sp. NRRL F-2664 TaxID=1463842 RepID=UPI00068B9563|nr:protein phosphatase 2C domain-containing protein [Streptomyces sp. NRRL F-2664]
MSMHRPSGCPSCAEPLEEGDRFCGLCGYALTSSPPAAATDHPTLPVPPAPPAPPARAPGPVPPPAPVRSASAAGYGGPAAGAGPHGSSGAGEPAPGWGSVASAAPTLVGDPGDWATAPAQSGPEPEPEPVPESRPYPAGASHPAPGHENPYGPDTVRGAAEVPETRHDRPGGDPSGGAPHENPYEAPHESPYGTAYDGPPPAGPVPGGKTCVACRAGHVDTDGYCEHCGHAQPRERDHVEEELGSVAAVSDRGLRHHRNEDSFAVSATALPDGSAATVAVVCDGVSSASRPDEASAAAAAAANEALLDALPRGAHPQEAMHEAILAAAAAVNALAPEVPGAQNAPACTLVGAVVSGGLLTIGWVGDSRAYWVPDDRAALPRRLTEDDSWAAQMVAAGLMGEAEAYADVRAHAITGWLGADAYDLEPHTAIFKPDHPGVVVVCTDGLWNYAESAREMAQVLPADAAVRPLHSAQVLVGHALDGGGHDNITVAVVPFATQTEREPGAAPEPGPAPEPEAEAEARPQV